MMPPEPFQPREPVPANSAEEAALRNERFSLGSQSALGRVPEHVVSDRLGVLRCSSPASSSVCTQRPIACIINGPSC